MIYLYSKQRAHTNRCRMKKQITYFSFFLIVPCLLLIPACVHKKDIDKQILHLSNQKKYTILPQLSPPPITIWVHGTVLFKKPPLYETNHKNPTLIKATDLPIDNRFSTIAHTIVNSDPHHFSLDEFYVFCWSGHFSMKERKRAAEKLHHELVSLVYYYEKRYHTYPTIRIIAHSHGGNVALHMAKLHTFLSPLSIKSLILLACPVQEKTMHLIDTPMFQRIYSLYSSLDFIQVLAPQLRRPEYIKRTNKHKYKFPTFSSRLFPQHPHVIQAKLKIDNFPISHTYFSSVTFVEMLPSILHTLDAWDTSAHKQLKKRTHKLLCIYKQKTLRRSNQLTN